MIEIIKESPLVKNKEPEIEWDHIESLFHGCLTDDDIYTVDDLMNSLGYEYDIDEMVYYNASSDYFSRRGILNKLNEYKERIEEDGHIVYAIMLKGSQNYNLNDSESDIDANAVLIPKLHQIAKGKYTKKYEFDSGEVTCHDIYSFAEIVSKGNPQWIEVCHTDYKLGGDLSMFKDFEINPSALKGMAMEKVKAFDKLYPSRAHMVEEFGYDPKQLHHLYRLYDLIKSGERLFKYKEGSKEKSYMMDLKRGRVPDNPDEANIMKLDIMEKIMKLTEESKLTYTQQEVDWELLDKIVIDYNINHYKEDTV